MPRPHGRLTHHRPKRELDFYRNEIQEFIGECTHGGVLDEEEFSNKISGLQAAASVDGVDPIEFKKMVLTSLGHSDLKKSA